jgi:DNA polymerase elongation subunit (family B)
MAKHIIFVSEKDHFAKNDDYIKTKLLKKWNPQVYSHLSEEEATGLDANLVLLFGSEILYRKFPDKDFGKFFRDQDGQVFGSLQNYKDFDRLEKKETTTKIKEAREKLNKFFSRFALVRVTDHSYFYRDIDFKKIRAKNAFKANFKFVEDPEGDYLSYEGKKLKKVPKEYQTFSQTYEEHLRAKDLFYYEQYPNIAHTRLLHYCTFDIETNLSLDTAKAPEPIISIAAHSNIYDKNFVWILKKKEGQTYDKEKFKNEKIFEFLNEVKMLRHFFDTMEKLQVDLLGGWNCIPTSQSVWGENKITSILEASNKLCDSNILFKSPISKKEKWEIELINGSKIYTSSDHRTPIIRIPKEKYTNLENKICENLEMTTEEMHSSKDSLFVELKLRTNENLDNTNYNLSQLYLAGLVYTDGSIKNKKYFYKGFVVSQSDKSFLKKLPFLTTKILGPWKNNYSRNVKSSLLGNAIHLIYNDKKEKELNFQELSTLSYKQFMSFLSGLLDGDGCNIRNKGIGLCDYHEGSIDKIYELCLWNGILSSISKNRFVLRFLNLKLSDLSLLKEKRWVKLKTTKIDRNSKTKAHLKKFRIIGNKCLIRIKKIKNTKKVVEMVDITTTTKYFYTHGMKTHNCDFFDIPYLLHRSKRLGVDFKNFLAEVYESIGKDGEKSYFCHEIILWDYLRYAKWIIVENKPIAWSLDAVSKHLFNEKKIEHEGIDVLWAKKDLSDLIEYNLKDVYLTEKIAQMQKIIEFPILYQKIAPQTYENVYFNSRFLETMIHQRFKQFKFPSKKKQKLSSTFKGALVLETKPGLFENVSVFDFSALYPSIMISLNLSKDTIIEDLKDFDPKTDIRIGNVMFTGKRKGVVPQLAQLLLTERNKLKKRKMEFSGDSQEFKILNDLEACFKATNNALYGVLGFRGFILYDQRVASSVTHVARETLRFVKHAAEEQGYQILTGDTDSIFIKVQSDSLEETIQKSKHLQDIFNKGLPEFLDKFTKNDKLIKTHIMQTVFEKSFSKLLLAPAKKKQVGFLKFFKGKILDKEELYIKGFEAIKDDTPTFFKKVLKGLYENILNNYGDVEKLKEYAKGVKKELKQQQPIDLVIRKKMSKRIEEYDSKVQHVKAIRNSNTTIKRGETVNILFVQDPRQVIHYDPELNLKFEIDYKKYFHDFLVKKIELIDSSLHYKLFLEKTKLMDISQVNIVNRIKKKKIVLKKLGE